MERSFVDGVEDLGEGGPQRDGRKDSQEAALACSVNFAITCGTTECSRLFKKL